MSGVQSNCLLQWHGFVGFSIHEGIIIAVPPVPSKLPHISASVLNGIWLGSQPSKGHANGDVLGPASIPFLGRTNDAGMVVPHISIPPNNALLPLTIAFGGSESVFGSSGVQIPCKNLITGESVKDMGCCVFPVVPLSLNVACFEYAPVPLDLVIAPNSVVAGFTLADFFTGLVDYAISVAAEVVTMGLGKLGDAAGPALKRAVKRGFKRGAAAGKKAGSKLARGATKKAAGKATTRARSNAVTEIADRGAAAGAKAGKGRGRSNAVGSMSEAGRGRGRSNAVANASEAGRGRARANAISGMDQATKDALNEAAGGSAWKQARDNLKEALIKDLAFGKGREWSASWISTTGDAGVIVAAIMDPPSWLKGKQSQWLLASELQRANEGTDGDSEEGEHGQ